MTCEATVDLVPFYRGRHQQLPPRLADPRPDFDWSRVVMPAARFVGNLLLDVAVVVATFAVVLLFGSAVVDFLLFTWRR